MTFLTRMMVMALRVTESTTITTPTGMVTSVQGNRAFPPTIAVAAQTRMVMGGLTHILQSVQPIQIGFTIGLNVMGFQATATMAALTIGPVEAILVSRALTYPTVVISGTIWTAMDMVTTALLVLGSRMHSQQMSLSGMTAI